MANTIKVSQGVPFVLAGVIRDYDTGVPLRGSEGQVMAGDVLMNTWIEDGERCWSVTSVHAEYERSIRGDTAMTAKGKSGIVAEIVKTIRWNLIARWSKETAAERRKFLEIPATGGIKNHPKEVLEGFEEGYRQGYQQACRDLQMHGYIEIEF